MDWEWIEEKKWWKFHERNWKFCTNGGWKEIPFWIQISNFEEWRNYANFVINFFMLIFFRHHQQSPHPIYLPNEKILNLAMRKKNCFNSFAFLFISWKNFSFVNGIGIWNRYDDDFFAVEFVKIEWWVEIRGKVTTEIYNLFYQHDCRVPWKFKAPDEIELGKKNGVMTC